MHGRCWHAAAVALALIAVQSIATRPAVAWCLFHCEPTEADARAVFENMVRARVGNVPFRIVAFGKTNGRTIAIPGMEGYELYYHAVVDFPSGIAPGRRDQNVWGQLLGMGANMSVQMALSEMGLRVTKGDKVDEDTVMETSSSLAFQKTEKGWLAADGRVY